MTNKQASVKAKLMEKYSKELDELLAKNEESPAFSELERRVSEFAEGILPETLSELQASKDFSPSVSRVSKERKK
jgi:hypothetical protein